MKITKLGHCCLLIKEKKLNILTDPGAYSGIQNGLKNIDMVLITHEHTDHLHIKSLKEVLKNNPKAKVYTNNEVAKKLDKEGIKYNILEGRNKIENNGVKIEAFDAKHEEIYGDFGQVQNTGYFIAEKLFYPGDAFHNPGKPVDILALPVAGPWCRIRDSIRYALELKPKKVFPIHDGMLQRDRIGSVHKVPENILSNHGIKFFIINSGDSRKF
jgi:L-ascorbate metabolism protein UlaG (beta-lactamase superfamily)